MAGMPHTTVPACIRDAMTAVRDAPVPDRVTGDFFTSRGFADGQGPHLVAMLRALGLVDGAGRPTIVWSRYRRPDQSAVVLAAALRASYPVVFERHPDAPARSLDEIVRVVARHTEHAPHHVARTADCFLRLCELADFTVPQLDPPRPAPDDALRLSSRERLLAMRRLTAAHVEALECVHHGLHRPAHVSVWNGFVVAALSVLSADGFAAVRRVRPSWHGATVEDLSVHTSGSLLLDMIGALDVFDVAEIDDLGLLLQRRDDCARPTFYDPDEHDTETYLAEVVAAAILLIDRAHRGSAVAPVSAGAAPSTSPRPTTRR